MKNVDSSDGTVAFRLYKSNGTDKTIDYCATGKWGTKSRPGVMDMHKPCLVIDSLETADLNKNVKKLVEFILDYNIRILNVAGHRAVPGMHDYVLRLKDLLTNAFSVFC